MQSNEQAWDPDLSLSDGANGQQTPRTWHYITFLLEVGLKVPYSGQPQNRTKQQLSLLLRFQQ
jgi:hypothetical protein